jgi:hypothetical protein
MSGEKKSVDESSSSEDELEQGKAVPRNLVEVETSSNKWKTEFENEISSIRINGEEVTKLHQAVKDLRKLREKSNRSIKILMFLIIVLISSSLVFCIYAFDYLLQFDVEKIDHALDLNIETIEKSSQGMVRMPSKSLVMLNAHKNRIIWDDNKSHWTFLNSFNGKTEPLTNKYFFYHPIHLDELGEMGIYWNGSEWKNEQASK